MKLAYGAPVFLLFVLATLGSGGCAVPDRDACLAAFEGSDFATDDNIISCVSSASRPCCWAVSRATQREREREEER